MAQPGMKEVPDSILEPLNKVSIRCLGDGGLHISFPPLTLSCLFFPGSSFSTLSWGVLASTPSKTVYPRQLCLLCLGKWFNPTVFFFFFFNMERFTNLHVILAQGPC